jgi:hypothetical protein
MITKKSQYNYREGPGKSPWAGYDEVGGVQQECTICGHNYSFRSLGLWTSVPACRRCSDALVAIGTALQTEDNAEYRMLLDAADTRAKRWLKEHEAERVAKREQELHDSAAYLRELFTEDE